MLKIRKISLGCCYFSDGSNMDYHVDSSGSVYGNSPELSQKELEEREDLLAQAFNILENPLQVRNAR